MRYHPGEGWFLHYASGGCTLPGYRNHDRYYSTEPAIAGVRFDDRRILAYKVGNNELAREAARHGRDVEEQEVLNSLSGQERAAFALAMDYLRDIDSQIIFWTHRLNRFRAGGVSGGQDPMGLVVGFKDVPALDHALGEKSKRVSIGKHENFVTFLMDPDGALRNVEMSAVEQGFHLIELKAGMHSGETIAKNAGNAPSAAPPMTEEDLATADQVTEIGRLFQ